jgi:hypothetical protein
MTNKSIVTALAFGFLGFTLSILPATAQSCYWQNSADCGPGRVATGETKMGEPEVWGAGVRVHRCCTKPVKQIGKGSAPSETGKAALRAACIHQGWRYDEQTGKCIKPSQEQAEEQTSSEQQSSSEHSSDDSYDDNHHKKKKKKRHHD